MTFTFNVSVFYVHYQEIISSHCPNYPLCFLLPHCGNAEGSAAKSLTSCQVFNSCLRVASGGWKHYFHRLKKKN